MRLNEWLCRSCVVSDVALQHALGFCRRVSCGAAGACGARGASLPDARYGCATPAPGAAGVAGAFGAVAWIGRFMQFVLFVVVVRIGPTGVQFGTPRMQRSAAAVACVGSELGVSFSDLGRGAAMSGPEQYLKRAIEIVQEAIKFDNEDKKEEAFGLYMKSLEWFELAQKCTCSRARASSVGTR